MTPEQFADYQAQALRLHRMQDGIDDDGARVSLDAVFVAVVALDAASVRQAPAKAARRAATAPIIDDAVRERLDALEGQTLPLAKIAMLCGLWPTTRERTRQLARGLRESGYKSTRIAGEVVFDLTPTG